MASGRCAGCGRIESIRKIVLHTIDCPAYLDLYRRDPQKCLSPAEELERHRGEDTTAEARAQRRSDRAKLRSIEHNRHQAASAKRWATPPDLLD